MFDPDALDRRDPKLIARALPGLEWIAARYHRLRVDGAALPDGPALLVANHNGGILGPDLACTVSMLWRRLGPDAPLYALAHDFVMQQATPIGSVLQRFGAIRATRDNARRALAAGAKVLVYPGGDLDAYRSFARRHEVVIRPRRGFAAIARDAGVPIVPIVARGAHTSGMILTEGAAIARALRMPRWARLERFPIALALPWGLALGPWLPYLPLPFAISLRVLPPITIAPDEDADDAAGRVERAMQDAMEAMC
ncbi:MAG TPA: 1-acyl-sn-glycerol-3-phosphate acyltransferase [Kofleriaceae bacterium]|nr:1-acyl-sn-glycerol-3-phosphate acyltransferase [Kofleriaceae bacterium]